MRMRALTLLALALIVLTCVATSSARADHTPATATRWWAHPFGPPAHNEVVRPTATATRRPSRAATATRPPVPTSTATRPPVPTSTATRPPVPTSTATRPPVPTSTATRPPVPTSTATRPPVPTSTALQCLPMHAARPIALCETGSGSGWWLHFVTRTGVLTGPYVPRARPAGETQAFQNPAGGVVRVTWLAGAVSISASYRNGEPYRFFVADGRVYWLER